MQTEYFRQNPKYGDIIKKNISQRTPRTKQGIYKWRD